MYLVYDYAIIVLPPGETDAVWVFDDESKLKRWVTTTDNDHGEGFSKCTFEMSKAGRGLFSGNLDTRVPKDGRIKRAGYAGIRSVRHQVGHISSMLYSTDVLTKHNIYLKGIKLVKLESGSTIWNPHEAENFTPRICAGERGIPLTTFAVSCEVVLRT